MASLKQIYCMVNKVTGECDMPLFWCSCLVAYIHTTSQGYVQMYKGFFFIRLLSYENKQILHI